MKKYFLSILLSSLLMSAWSQTPWKLNSSAISFKIKNAGLTVDGSFEGLLAEIKFDAGNFTKSLIETSIDVKTINTGIDARDGHLKKEEYFNADKFPKITLKSIAFTKENNDTFKGFFKLTIKGITKNVIIPFSYNESGNNTIFKGSFNLNRRDYEIGGSSWTMSDDVIINLVINASK